MFVKNKNAYRPIVFSKLVFFRGTLKEFGLWYALLSISPLLSRVCGANKTRGKALEFSSNPLINAFVVDGLGDLDKIEQEEWKKMKASMKLFRFETWGDLRPAWMKTPTGQYYRPLFFGIWVRDFFLEKYGA